MIDWRDALKRLSYVYQLMDTLEFNLIRSIEDDILEKRFISKAVQRRVIDIDAKYAKEDPSLE